MNRVSGCAFALAAVAAFAPVARAGEIVISAPAGWLDVSPGAPEENLRNLPPEVLKPIRSGQLTAMAFDVAHTTAGFTPNYNAVPLDRPLRIRASSVDEAADGVLASIRERIPGARLVDRGIVEVSGVNALKVVYDSEPNGIALRQMAVVVPGSPRSAVVTYSALRTQFDALRPAFEAHAASISGAEEGGGLGAMLARAGKAGIVGGLSAAVLAGIARAVMRRKRAA